MYTLSYLADMPPSARDHKKMDDDAVLRTGSVDETRNSQILVSAPVLLLRRNLVVLLTASRAYTFATRRQFDSESLRESKYRTTQRNWITVFLRPTDGKYHFYQLTSYSINNI